MKRILIFVEKIVPRYSWVPLLLVVLFNFSVYGGCRMIAGNWKHFDLSNPIDDAIPFCTFFIVFYVLAYVQWMTGYILAARSGKITCYYICMADLIAKFICALFFVFLPTTVQRPEIVGSNVFDKLTAFIYQVDASDNLFPSIHCLESWMCFRSLKWIRNVPAWFKWFTLALTVCVFASTVVLKQHVLVDIIGGVLVLEIGLLISKRICAVKWPEWNC